jgi:hypothetical protein
MFVLELPIVEEQLAELEGEGDLTFFTSVAVDGSQKIIQVHIRRRKFYDLIYSAPGIKDGAHERMTSPLVEGARLRRK